MSDLTTLIDRLSSARVLVVGDVMLDRFTHGRVDRISPEAPIPVLVVERETVMLGGAGNVASNLAALGADVRFLSVIGDDAAGADLSRLARERLGNADGLLVEKHRQTTTKVRFTAGAQQLLRADRETLAPILPQVAKRLRSRAVAAMAECGVLILSDYGKGVLTTELTADLIAAANARDCLVLVDPKGRDFTRYRGASCITPNRRELSEATGQPVRNDLEVEQASAAIIQSTGIGAVLTTRSEQGMSLVRAGPSNRRDDFVISHMPAEAREVFDVSGAGDTVMAALAAALATGCDLGLAAQLANAAAGIVVGKAGTATVQPDELRAALHRQDWEQSEAKVVSLDGALERIARWRRKGQSVGFTNGCFDLLHPGHIALISQARAACDRLIVGLNSDASVRRLKGDTRPVQSEMARATVLASLSNVDLVVVFTEDTPLSLISALRPDILVKGADYTVDRVVGADLVQSYGGRVVLADLVQGQSTTGTIARMKG
jgi:D-beta-D-heptose 7-phosphate kinase / D-beta-D-heptose 1-phosphate adenosyltransferase